MRRAGASHVCRHGISKEGPKQNSFMEEQNSIVSGGQGSCAGTSFHNCALNWFLFTVFLWLLHAQLYVSICFKGFYETVV